MLSNRVKRDDNPNCPYNGCFRTFCKSRSQNIAITMKKFMIV